MTIDPVIEPDALLGRQFRLLEAAAPEGVGRADIARVPLEVWEAAAKSGETSFENVAYWERAIAALGIDGSISAVVFDDGRLTEAARVWFILQYFGAEAYILNGGWPAIRTCADLLATPDQPAGPTRFRARPGSGAVGLIDRSTLKAELTDVRVFDARTKGEFAG